MDTSTVYDIWADLSFRRRKTSETALGVIPANSLKSPLSAIQLPMSAAPIIVKD